jgi:putative transcriptional regulator
MEWNESRTIQAFTLTEGTAKMSKNLRLKSARAAKDMSQQWLADRVDVSRQTINAIEKGDYNPSIKLCIAICKVLDKTLNDLFWEEDDET